MKRPHILLGTAFMTMLTSSLSGLQAAPSPIKTSPINTSPINTSPINICANAKNAVNVPMRGLDNWLYLDSEFALNRFAYPGQYEPIKRFNDALWQRGIKMIVIPIPNRPSVNTEHFDLSNPVQAKFKVDVARADYNDSVTIFRNAGITTVNVMEAMREYGWNGGKGNLFFTRDIHWTPTGSKVAAEATAKEVKAWSGYYNALPKANYVNEPSKIYNFKGSIPYVIETYCKGSNVPPEAVQGYQPVRQGGNLLGEEKIEVVLTGSSYSGPPFDPDALNYNFAGNLEEALKTGVINAGISGGTYDVSIESYLLSPEYVAQKPKFLLYEFWFFPYGQPLHSFRRIIPSIYGACTGNNAVANGPTVPLVNGKLRPIIYTPGTARIKGSNKYIYMKFSDKNVMKFNMILTYDDGQTETVPVERSKRFSNPDGRFFFELNDKYTGNLLSAAIQTEITTDSKVTARICSVPAPINTN
jgi:alginate biosynthesis protein AlgX